jgi:hypothetical protein
MSNKRWLEIEENLADGLGFLIYGIAQVYDIDRELLVKTSIKMLHVAEDDASKLFNIADGVRSILEKVSL